MSGSVISSCLHLLFEEQARRTPDAVAAIFARSAARRSGSDPAWEHLSYRRLERRAERLAERLRAAGAGPDTLVALYLRRSPDLAAAVLGVLKAGAACLPLERSYPRARLVLILEDAGAAVLLTEPSLAGELGAGGGAPALRVQAARGESQSQARARDFSSDQGAEPQSCWSISRIPQRRAGGKDPLAARLDFCHGLLGLPGAGETPSASADRRAADPANLAYAVYTSGSTGRPKGVAMSHGALSNLVAWQARVHGPATGARSLQFAPLSFDVAFQELFSTWAAGGTLVLVGDRLRRDASGLLRLLARAAVGRVFLPPAALEQLAEVAAAEPDAGRLGQVITAGEQLRVTAPVRRWLERSPGVSLHNHYGPSETHVVTAEVMGGAPGAWPALPAIGRPIGGCRAHLLERGLREVTAEGRGELHLAGAGLARGYLGRPAATAAVFVPDPWGLEPGGRLYRSGDLARRLEDGGFAFLGRRDAQVKIRGFRVEPGEVEAVLAEHPDVRAAAVVARGTDAGRRLEAYVVAAGAALPAAARHAFQDRHVGRWRSLYDDVYERGAPPEDPELDATGWHSSYSGRPLGAAAMREWVESTVERLLELGIDRSTRVLEIGCGTGMIARRLAPRSASYLGTDLSAAGLSRLRAAAGDLERLRLLECRADDFRGLAAGAFDLVILNSVTQCFPSARYLLRVLRGAVRAAAEGGTVFVGDVRSLPLLEAFCASVELHQAASGLPAAALRERLRRRLEGEEQLVIDPRFFAELGGELPRIRQVRIQPRVGRDGNEMTRFRYDATLHLDQPGPAAARPRRLDWRRDALSLEVVDRLLAGEGEVVRIDAVPNRRLWRENLLRRRLADPGGPATAGALRRELRAAEPEGVEPDDWRPLAAGRGYSVELSWARARPDGAYDAVLWGSGRRGRRHVGARPPALFEPAAGRPATLSPRRSRVAEPLRRPETRRLTSALRAYLEQRLPEVMVPAAFSVVPELPLLSSGKLDRGLLRRRPPLTPADGSPRQAPRTAVEEALAAIWKQVLGDVRFGIHDNFFRLGGHSLSATRVVSRLRSVFEVELSALTLFERPTVAGMARAVEDGLRAGGRPTGAPTAVRPRPAERPPRPALSFAQQRLWFLDRLEPGNAAYNIAAAFRLDGRLQPAALAAALAEVVRRHEALRTVFPSRGGRPYQAICPAAGRALATVDLSALEFDTRHLAKPSASNRRDGPFASNRRGEACLARISLARSVPQKATQASPLHEELKATVKKGQLKSCPRRRRQTVARALVEAEARRPFDLGRGPLFRPLLLRLGRRRHALLLITHHIVSDGWSEGVLYRELSELYGAACAAERSPLPGLEIQYADFALEQRRQLAGERLAGLLGYWRQQLAGLPALELPADRPRPAVQTFSGAVHRAPLDAELAAGLERLSLASRCSLFMTLLAAFFALLGRLTGERDLAVGTPIANRVSQAVEGLIGFFVNSLVLRCGLAGGEGFSQLLARVRRVALDAYSHQDLPFEKLVDELSPERDLGRNPLFQVLFALQNAPRADPELADLEVSPFDFEPGVARFDLELHLYQPGSGSGALAGEWVYNTDLFEATTVARLAGQFAALLSAAIADPDRPVAELPVLSPAQRHQALIEWQGHSRVTRAHSRAPLQDGQRSNVHLGERPRHPGAQPAAEPSPQRGAELTVYRLFRARAARAPDAVALVAAAAGGAVARLSYGRLERRCRRFSRHLRRLGIGPESRVGICLERSFDLVAGLLAVLDAGAAWVPLDPSYPRRRLAFMLADSGASVVLTQRRLAGRLPAAPGRAVALVDELPEEPAAAAPPSAAPPDPRRLACVLYTSGSSGRPKGVALSHSGAAALTRWAQRAFGAERLAAVVASTSICFDLSVFEILVPLASGGRVLLAENVLEFPELPFAGEATLVNTVPSAFAELVRGGGLPGSPRVVNLAGEPLARELADAAYAAGAEQVWNLYGPSEDATYSTAAVLPRGDRRPPAIGRPVAGTRALVLGPGLEPLPPGAPGELCLGGAGLARGYWRRPALSAERFVPDPFGGRGGAPGGRLFRTGDRARARPDGELDFLGRADRQVKLRGFRIELGEVEAAIEGHPAVREAAVEVRGSGTGRRLVAWVTPERPAGTARERQAGDRVARWRVLYDELYQRPAPDVDPAFDTTGWIGSASGEAIPAADMREWLERTVERVLALEPSRVLEIGCGTGMVLARLAPHCRSYLGTDFSAAVLESVRSRLLAGGSLPAVRLERRPALDFSGIEPGAFDTVVLNSVVQYFPGVDYLLAVLRGAVAATAPGGAIFVGDLRSLPLAEDYYGWLERETAGGELSPEELRARVRRRRLRERELLIDPAFFHGLLAAELPRIAAVRVLPRTGRRNELTRFRLDVVLHLDSAPVGIGAIAAADRPPRRPWSAYANDPLAARAARTLVPDLRRRLERRLPAHMVPAAFELLERLPRLPNGKLDRGALPAPGDAGGERRRTAAAPRDELEQSLVEIWRRVLGRPRLGVDDHFFKLGGHSLLATQVTSRIRRELGVELPIRALFDAPTVALLARRVRRRLGASAAAPVPRAARSGELPLSFAQERLWFLDQLDPGRSFYNVPSSYRLSGELDVAALAAAWAALRRRHEVLRTSFPSAGGRPRQRVAEVPAVLPRPARLQTVDLSGLDAGAARAAAGGIVAREAARPFDLSVAPPVRILLLRCCAREHLLFLCLHHIVTDGWSDAVLRRELAALYRAFAGRRPSPLPEPELQYADFAVWQRRRLRGGKLEDLLGYWRQQLAGLVERELPADRPRPAAPTYRAGVHRRALPAPLARRLQALAVDRGASLHMTLAAAFAGWLGRLTGWRDVALGSPAAGRGAEELEGLIGFFVNTLVLRADLAGDPSFVELLARLRRAGLAAAGHQDLPFARLVEELKPARDAARNPLFQVLFALQAVPHQTVPHQTVPHQTVPHQAVPHQTVPRATLELAGLEVEPLAVDPASVHFDLELHLWPQAGSLACEWIYGRDRFDATRIARWAASFERWLAALAAAPERRLAELPWLGAVERHQVLVAWNDVPAAGFEDMSAATLEGLFTARAECVPDAVAIDAGGRSLSFGELDRCSAALAGELRRRGVGPERRVAVVLERGPRLVIGLLGVLRAGGACVPLDADSPPERLRRVLERAGARWLLTQERPRRRLPSGLGARWLELGPGGVLTDASGPPAPPLRDASGARADNLAFVIHTSGSGGRPKGVAVHHRGLSGRLRWGQATYPLGAGDAVLQLAPVSFDFALWEIFAALAAGARAVPASSGQARDVERLARLIDRRRVTVAHFVPAHLEAWMEVAVARRTTLRRVFAGGEKLSAAARERFHARFPGVELDNQYGPTETSIDVSYWRCRQRGAGAEVPIGRPIAGTRIQLLDGRLRPVAAGAPGELAIAGTGVARGYLDPPPTAASFVPDPFAGPGSRLYLSGDLGRFRSDGAIEFLGRLDRQVKVRGVRVEPAEIEEALRGHPAVASAAVTASDGRLVAHVVAAGRSVRPSDLRRFLERRLPAAMIPSAVVELDRLPRTPAGKVDRSALGHGTPAAVAGVQSPRTPVEEILSEVWRRVLRVRAVGVHDDFFAAGGHSLLATRVTSRLRRVLGVELPVRALFDHPTIARLAAHVAGARRARAAAPPLVPAPEPRAEAPPLSFAQERLWFLDRLEGPSAVYNMPAAFRLEGVFDPGAAARALGEIARRHQVLRSVFEAAGGEARQVVAAGWQGSLGVADLGRLTPAHRRRLAARLLAEQAARPFDLERGPLLRAGVLRLAGDEHLLWLNLHHIVSDGWSTGVLRRELSALYAAFRRGRPSPLPEPRVQYADFALWQRRWLRGAALEARLAYWRRRLDGVGELQLPADRPRPEEATYGGAGCRLPLPPALAPRLEALARGAGASLYMTLLAAFATLLGRAAGQRDVAVGSPIAGRGVEEIEGLIGFFVNTLVMRCDLGADPSFVELLGRVREAALAAYDQQDLPFEKLVEATAPARDLGRHPLFQVLFSLQNAPRPALELPGLRVSELELEPRVVRFDQEWHLWQEGGELRGQVIFNTDLFDPSTVDRTSRHLVRLLGSIVEEPERRLGELALLSAAERHQLVAEWGAGPAPARGPRRAAARGFLELLAERVAAAPDAVALRAGDVSLSYRRLDRRARSLAAQLRALGVGPEVKVAIELERSPALWIAALAVLLAGGVYVPVDPIWPRRRRRFILEDAGAVLRLVAGGAAAAAGGRRIVLDRAGRALGLPPEQPAAPASSSPEHPAYLIYTSGSTGRPKGVLMRRGALDRLVLWQTSALAGGRRVLQFASPSFDVSFQEVFTTWCSGGTLVLVPEVARRDPEAWSAVAAAARVERLFLPVVALQQLAEGAARPLPALREVVTAGEQLQVTAPVRALFERSDTATLHNHYGPTETHVVTCHGLAGPPRRWPRRPAIGRPIAGARIHLLDRRLAPVPIGVAGEICAGGGVLARGYHRRPAATAAVFVPEASGGAPGARLYKTGDLGRRRRDGAIEFSGRADHQLKIRGFRVEPGEIEAVLERHPRIRRALVSAAGPAPVPAERRLIAHLLAAGELDLDGLRPWLRARLPEHMVPAAFVVLEQLPLTATGKVDRRSLPALDAARPAGDSYLAPAGDVERRLAAIFAELLGWEKIGAGDDFFALGGHSLLAVRLVARIEQQFGLRLPLAAVFRRPTVAALAAVVRRRRAPASSPLVALQPRGDREPLFLVHPGGGHVHCYRALAVHLQDRPVYGLEAELDGAAGVEDLAASYLAAVRAARPRGPYLLGGWSMGGLIAYEMARQALAAGLDVPFLALLDAAPAQGPYDESTALSRFARDLGLPSSSSSSSSSGHDLNRVLHAARQAELLATSTDLAELRRRYRLFERNLRAMLRYRPGRYDGRLTLLRARGGLDGVEPAWAALAAGLEVVIVPGDHHSMIREPHVRVLARELERRLPASGPFAK